MQTDFDFDSNTPSSLQSSSVGFGFGFFFWGQRKVYATQKCGLVFQRLPHSGCGSDSKRPSIYMFDIILNKKLQPGHPCCSDGELEDSGKEGTLVYPVTNQCDLPKRQHVFTQRAEGSLGLTAFYTNSFGNLPFFQLKPFHHNFMSPPEDVFGS